MAANAPPPLPSEGAAYQDVLVRLATVSGRISDLLRTLGIGTVVFCWGLFTADKGLAHKVATDHRIWIVITAAIAVMGLLFDLLQAVAAYWVANSLRSKMERLDLQKAPYPYADKIYRSQTFFFVSKSILMPLATVSIIVLLFVMLWTPELVAPAPMCCCQCGPAPADNKVSPAPVGPHAPK